jgi:hypothetical protein
MLARTDRALDTFDAKAGDVRSLVRLEVFIAK